MQSVRHNLFKKAVGVGANCDTSHLISSILSYVNSNFKVGYSYQFSSPLSGLITTCASSKEVLLSYRFGHQAKDVSIYELNSLFKPLQNSLINNLKREV